MIAVGIAQCDFGVQKLSDLNHRIESGLMKELVGRYYVCYMNPSLPENGQLNEFLSRIDIIETPQRPPHNIHSQYPALPHSDVVYR